MTERNIRFYVIGGFLTALAVLTIFRVVYIQNSENTAAFLTAEAERAKTPTEIIPSRGLIFDRYGFLLAGIKEAYELGVDLNQAEFAGSEDTIAKDLKDILDIDYYEKKSEYEQYIQDTFKDNPPDYRYMVIRQYVSPEDIAKLQERDDYYTEEANKKRGDVTGSLYGLHWSMQSKRYYPEKTLASNILGFMMAGNSTDDPSPHGYMGVEQEYNEILKGVTVSAATITDPFKAQDNHSAIPGDNIYLTIDREIQSMVEQTLYEELSNNGAESGTILVYNPKTGEIIAMASTPQIDINQVDSEGNPYPGDPYFNRAISNAYEPGSVFKILTMAAGLDSGAVQPDTQYLDQGTIEQGGFYFHNWDWGAWGWQDMTGCMQHSLNVCLVYVAQETGQETFYQYLRAFGVGQSTKIDMAGEVPWPLLLPGDGSSEGSAWTPSNLGANAFGQAVMMTPIQMVQAIGAVANDGKMMWPHVVSKYVHDGRVITIDPMVVGTPIKEETADTLSNMLANSVENEAKISVEGYRLAGKTGTASIAGPDGRYLENATNASFVGWGPVDDPQFLVYIWFERPTSDIWGSTVAAPVFEKVARRLIVLMDIPPDSIRMAQNQ